MGLKLSPVDKTVISVDSPGLSFSLFRQQDCHSENRSYLKWQCHMSQYYKEYLSMFCVCVSQTQEALLALPFKEKKSGFS